MLCICTIVSYYAYISVSFAGLSLGFRPQNGGISSISERCRYCRLINSVPCILQYCYSRASVPDVTVQFVGGSLCAQCRRTGNLRCIQRFCSGRIAIGPTLPDMVNLPKGRTMPVVGMCEYCIRIRDIWCIMIYCRAQAPIPSYIPVFQTNTKSGVIPMQHRTNSGTSIGRKTHAFRQRSAFSSSFACGFCRTTSCFFRYCLTQPPQPSPMDPVVGVGTGSGAVKGQIKSTSLKQMTVY